MTAPKPLHAPHRVALLFNANKVYDREIIAGVGSYLQSTRVSWDLFLEEDFRARLPGMAQWEGDGIIADFDDPEVAAALAGSRLPVVAVGGSYTDAADYPAGLPYVATDNAALVKLAHDHLIEAGLPHLAMYSLPSSPTHRWATERERAFERLVPGGGDAIYRGLETSAVSWDMAIERLTAWIDSLPKPVGIIGISDARARHLLQACSLAEIAVPDQVAIVGIDNDPLTRSLARISLSSVRQGTEAMGRTAAQLLHRMLHGARLPDTRIMVAPPGINAQASSAHIAPEDALPPPVMRARYYIRQYACQGIKTDQVADYVGISRSSLEAQFRAALNTTVHQALLTHRLAAAKTLLAATDLPSAEIAVRCGFTSLQYLYAVFKREVGCTPREWRDAQTVTVQASVTLTC